MLEKRITFAGVDKNGNPLVEALRFHSESSGIEKTASYKLAELEPEMRDFIADIKPSVDKLYVLVNALGAFEFWGPNWNGDAFKEQVLANEDPSNGYKTFLRATVFRHHLNKDPKKGFGSVVVAVYNPRMHRVELLLCIDRAKATELGHQDLVDALDAGENPAVSMGMRTPYDICSWCQHKSHKPDGSDRCDCLKKVKDGGKGCKLQIRDDGVVCCMLNPVFRAFDLSFVTIGADGTSFAIAKVANRAPVVRVEKVAAQDKFAELLKRIPAMRVFESRDPAISADVLNHCSQHSMSDVMSASALTGVVLKPQEFQRLMLVRMGKPDVASALDSAKRVIPACPSGAELDCSMSPAGLPHGLVRALSAAMPQRSVYEQFLQPSRMLPTPSSVTVIRFGSDPLLDYVSRAYDGYRQSLITSMPFFARAASTDPRLLSMMNPGWFEAAVSGLDKTAGIQVPTRITLGLFPLTYLFTRLFEKAGEGGVMQFVKRHPVIASSYLVGLMRAVA